MQGSAINRLEDISCVSFLNGVVRKVVLQYLTLGSELFTVYAKGTP